MYPSLPPNPLLALLSSPFPQLLKLGLVNPECSLDGEAATLYNQIWANNGDAISMQYAGTAAMKVSPQGGVGRGVNGNTTVYSLVVVGWV